MRIIRVIALVVLVAVPAQFALADDLTGENRILCAAVQATYCVEGGECAIDLPWNLNIPEFIEIDLIAKMLNTTAASGENRSTPIAHLTRENGLIVLQGFEMGRAFSFVITEETGRLAVAVAREGYTVAIFGSCTPLPAVSEPGRN